MDEEYIPRMSDTDYGKRGQSQKPGSGKRTSNRNAKAGDSDALSGTPSIEDLEKQMKAAAARLDFEEAARLRDIIRGMK